LFLLPFEMFQVLSINFSVGCLAEHETFSQLFGWHGQPCYE